MMTTDEEKYCPRCKQAKSKSAFNKSRPTRDGLHSYCRDCTQAIGAEWRRANPKKLYESVKRAKAKNPEKYRAMQRAWDGTHRDAVRASHRRHEEAHPYNTRIGWHKQYYQSNKQQIRIRQQVRNQAPEAKQLNALKTRRYRTLKGHKRILGWPMLRAWFGGYCLCCGATARIEADHVIPLARGGADTLANLQPLCRTCNASKGVQTIDYRNPEQIAACLAFYALIVVWAWWNIPPRPFATTVPKEWLAALRRP